MEISIYSEKFWMFSYYMFHNVPNIILSCIECFWLYSTFILLSKRVAHTFHGISYGISKIWIIDHICTEIPADLDKIWNLRFYIKIWKIFIFHVPKCAYNYSWKAFRCFGLFSTFILVSGHVATFFHDNLWNIS